MSTRNLWPAKYLFKVALIVIIIDQLSKWLMMHATKLKSLAVLPFLNLNLAFNRGAAFGILSEANGWQRWFFVAIAIAVCSFILIMSLKLNKKDKWEIFALGLILGGALGNLLDRMRLGYVVDFFDFYIGKWHWYTFNVADTAIFIGAVLLGLYTLLRKS